MFFNNTYYMQNPLSEVEEKNEINFKKEIPVCIVHTRYPADLHGQGSAYNTRARKGYNYAYLIHGVT